MFNILNIAHSGMRTAKTHIATHAHNIANATTPGFKRHIVHQAEVVFRDHMNRMVGNGVKVTDITRANNPWLDNRLSDARSRLDALNATKPIADNLNEVLSDNKLLDAYNELYESISALSAFPSERELQQDVAENAKKFADSVNELNSQLSDISIDINNKIMFLSEENAYLFSQRDMAMRSGDQTMLEQVEAEINSVNTQINALRNVQAQVVVPTQERLNEYISGTVDSLNSVHSTGTNFNGDPTGPLFGYIDGKLISEVDSAVDISVSNVNELYDTIDFGVSDYGTFKQSYAVELVKVGSYARQVGNNALSAQEDYESALSAWQEGVGVNLEEEYLKSKTQQAVYDFNAMILKTADQMIGTLLNIRS